MWRHHPAPAHSNVHGMVREELRRLGYADRRRVPRQVFHQALNHVCHRLLLQANRGHGNLLEVAPVSGMAQARWEYLMPPAVIGSGSVDEPAGLGFGQVG